MKMNAGGLVLLLWMCGCATTSTLGNLDALRSENRQNLLNLEMGMTKEQALQTMGTRTATEIYGGMFAPKEVATVTNPYASEILQGDQKKLEVIYYFTEMKNGPNVDPWGQVHAPYITNDELTPLVFDEGKLVGWGWSFLEDCAKKYQLRSS